MAAPENLKLILEAALLAAGRPLSLDAMLMLFMDEEQPERKELRAALEELAADYQGRGIEVREVASGWRIQVGAGMARWVSRLWEEKPGRYSRATMETLALIAYRQPITRGEIEDIRGVSVNTNTIKTLQEREWIRVVGHRDVPGKPALYGTTREFLDYFNLRGLDDLPTLAEIRDLDEINRELNLEDPDRPLWRQAGDAAVPDADHEPDEGEAAGETAAAEAGAGGDEQAMAAPGGAAAQPAASSTATTEPPAVSEPGPDDEPEQPAWPDAEDAVAADQDAPDREPPRD
jgi:segregation and condensation protein B